MVFHPIPPVFDASSQILILGSFPSVKSRETGFYYGHPQNRFWRVLAAVFDADVPATIEEKRGFLFSHHIALWDVIASCEIEGSADHTIRSVVPNDLSGLLAASSIRQIYGNGKTACRYYRQYAEPLTKRSAVCLPSTSPANAAWSLERLVSAWQPIRSDSSEAPIPGKNFHRSG